MSIGRRAVFDMKYSGIMRIMTKMITCEKKREKRKKIKVSPGNGKGTAKGNFECAEVQAHFFPTPGEFVAKFLICSVSPSWVARQKWKVTSFCCPPCVVGRGSSSMLPAEQSGFKSAAGRSADAILWELSTKQQVSWLLVCFESADNVWRVTKLTLRQHAPFSNFIFERRENFRIETGCVFK